MCGWVVDRGIECVSAISPRCRGPFCLPRWAEACHIPPLEREGGEGVRERVIESVFVCAGGGQGREGKRVVFACDRDLPQGRTPPFLFAQTPVSFCPDLPLIERVPAL